MLLRSTTHLPDSGLNSDVPKFDFALSNITPALAVILLRTMFGNDNIPLTAWGNKMVTFSIGSLCESGMPRR